MTHATRESWLAALALAMRPTFEAKGYKLPEKLRVTCGWPSSGALSKKGGSRTIGECFDPSCSKDGHTEVFVSPVLADTMRVADVLAHELIHAALPKAAHGKPFARAMLALGLEGKPTATVAGAEFLDWCKPLVEALGAYPHASLDLTLVPRKRQKNRQLKVTCPTCGYTARAAKKWLKEAGAPLCPCNAKAMTPEVDLEDEEELEEEVADAA